MTEPTKLPKLRIALIFLAPLALLSLAWGTPLALRSQLGPEPKAASASAAIDGAAIYAKNCAYCHGATGDGKGSVILQPPARRFGRDKFKFATTANGVPCDADLMKLLERGIPGSAMPPFPQLTAEERKAVIEHVRTLTRKGLYDRLVDKAIKDDEDPEPDKFARVAAAGCLPGEQLAIPRIPQATPESIERGKAVYAKLCASCHGPTGKGDGPQVKDLKNEDGAPNFPRDLTLGLYKAGGSPEELYARIMKGIPGTPMPASDNQPQNEIFDLIHYLRTLPK